MMNRLKGLWRRYLAHTKALYQQYKEEDEWAEEHEDEDEDYCSPSVNPSTGMPMISSSVDCMGNAFGTSSSSNRY